MTPAPPIPPRRTLRPAGAALALGLLGLNAPAHAAATIQAIGVENEYADVIAQIGGPAVHVTAVMSDPNTDPHAFEVSPKTAAAFAAADLVVENGLGYDSWADKMIAATPRAQRRVINVQHLLSLPDDTPNPHLWYDPRTMPVVARAIAARLAQLDPGQAAAFAEREKAFEDSLKPWFAALAAFKANHPHTAVAVTEPVGDDMLRAAGASILTPWALEAAIMNDTDPAPQDVTRQNDLLSKGQVAVFLYNQQVTDPLTQAFLERARKGGVPVVGVYETMPAPGYSYQSWMLAEVKALDRAVSAKVSSESLLPASPSQNGSP